MRRVIVIATVLAAAAVAGCAWVKPTAGGEKVREETAANVGSCQEVGSAYGKTRTSVGLPRNQDVIRDEQVTLARNQAARIGGDTIVQDGAPTADGTLNFKVYRCR
jgi:hypothetical protein